MNKEEVKSSDDIDDEIKFDQCSKPVKLIIVGCGQRGYVYSRYAIEKPNRLSIVAVCDTIKYRREKLGKEFGLDESMIFENWNDIIKLDKFADAVLISTPDQYHCEPAVAFANKKYHLLVEKPLAITKKDCKKIVSHCKSNQVMLSVCHVLRYSPVNIKLKQLLDSGLIGKILNIQHLEPVGYYHNAHSYVRGNWSKLSTSTFMLLAKSCHDIDLIHYFMGGIPCKKVSSFGSLTYFKKENKPTEPPSMATVKRCIECPITNRCPYSAQKIYIEHYPWKRDVLVPDKDPTIENVKESLKTGPYGICVYESNNDVVDQQVVNMEFQGGILAAFQMVAFTESMCIRKIKIFGSHGELECNGHDIIYNDFRFGDKEIFKPYVNQSTKMSNHGASDYYLMRSFVHAVSTNDPTQILSGPDDTLSSHLLVFKAEKSRLTDKTIIL